MTEIRVSEIRVSKIRVSKIRISSNHRELHGGIFEAAKLGPKKQTALAQTNFPEVRMAQ